MNDRYRIAWQSARQRAAVLSAEVTRRAPLLGEYAAENTRLHQWHDEDRTALTEMRATIERLRSELTNRSEDLNRAALDAVRYADEVARLRTAQLAAPADRAAEWRAAAIELDNISDQFDADNCTCGDCALCTWKEAASHLRRKADEMTLKPSPMDPVHILGLDSGDLDEVHALRARLQKRPTPATKTDEVQQAEEFGPDVVAYAHPVHARAYLCRTHGDGKPGLTPLTADDLEHGGLCADCGIDVLIPQTGEGQ